MECNATKCQEQMSWKCLQLLYWRLVCHTRDLWRRAKREAGPGRPERKETLLMYAFVAAPLVGIISLQII